MLRCKHGRWCTHAVLWPAMLALAPLWSQSASLVTPREVVQSVVKNDPHLRAQAERLKAAGQERAQAGLWENPELEGKVVSEPAAGVDQAWSGTLKQPLAFKGPLRKAARLQGELSEVEYRLARQEAAGAAVMALARLRQIDEIQSVWSQQLSLSDQALSRFAKLPTLTAAQQAERDTFQFSREAVHLQQPLLEHERLHLLRTLSIASGLPAESLPVQWSRPKRMPAWPDWKEDLLPWSVSRLREQLAGQDVKAARAQSLPPLALGLAAEGSQGAAGSEAVLGLALEMEFPLWNRNQRSRRAAHAQNQASALEERAHRERMKRWWQDHQGHHDESTKELDHSQGLLNAARGRLTSIRRNYLKGRLSAAAALGAMEQYEAMLKAYHELESETLEAFWTALAWLETAEETQP